MQPTKLCEVVVKAAELEKTIGRLAPDGSEKQQESEQMLLLASQIRLLALRSLGRAVAK